MFIDLPQNEHYTLYTYYSSNVITIVDTYRLFTNIRIDILGIVESMNVHQLT